MVPSQGKADRVPEKLEPQSTPFETIAPKREYRPTEYEPVRPTTRPESDPFRTTRAKFETAASYGREENRDEIHLRSNRCFRLPESLDD
jgi:hypothetical protein